MEINKNGFTLAEVLITLGIIGVVAAMTIPTLMNNIQDAQFHTATKKAFSVLSNATSNLLQENSGFNVDLTSSDLKALSKNSSDAYKYYIKYSRQDLMSNIQAQDWVGYKSTKTIVAPSSARYGLVLSDGSIVRFAANQDCIGALSTGKGNACISIMVDVNGNNKPNMFGKDVHSFWLIKDNNGNYKIMPSGLDIDGQGCAVNSQDLTTSYGCTEYVINNQTLPQ